MKELIKLNTSEGGKKTVSAKELYLGLGLNKAAWSRWSKTNIEQNEFFRVNYDWLGVQLNVEGNETTDYEKSLEFAKHIAMMTRTEKSHQYRNYFLICEAKLKEQQNMIGVRLSPMEILETQFKVLKEQETKINHVENKVNNLENNMTIDHGQAVNIKHAVDLAVKRLCFGGETPAYTDTGLKRKLYQYVWRSIKDYFEVTAYHNLLRKDMQRALEYIQELKLQGALLREVQEANNQMCVS